MNKAFEKILKKIEEKRNKYQRLADSSNFDGWNEEDIEYSAKEEMCEELKEIVQEVTEEYNGGWIPCDVKMPPVETEVFVVAKRKYRGVEVKYINTTAIYEDGTVLENDSCWLWEDIEGEWDEEEDCLIIPEGWWEFRHFNPDDVYNNLVDDEIIAWQPLPEPYQQKGE